MSWYLGAKQTINLPIRIANNDCSSIRLPTMMHSSRSYQSLDLSTIYETSFEFESLTDHSNNKTELKSVRKRRPLQEIDINSFNSEKRKIKNENFHFQNSTLFTLVSDGDKENLPVTMKKRSILSTNVISSNKKQKKNNK